VAGSAERAGVEENVQLVAFVTSAESETEPPEAVREVGLAAKFATVSLGGAAASVTLTGLALTATEPVTTRWNVKVFAFVLRLTGTLTLSETVPFEQGSVVGSPARVGVEEKAQLVALAICAVSDKAPPEAPREVGAEANDDTFGFEAACEAVEGTSTAAPARAKAKVTPRTGMTRNELSLDLMD